MDSDSGAPLRAEARAKINLFLEVLGSRPDGYHDIVSVFQELPLADTLEAFPAEAGRTELVCDDPALPVDGRNLVWRAIDRLRALTGREDGIALRLTKRIPSGAGLGGGSSDAAAALRLASALWGLELSPAELAACGAEVGSDVPFFLVGGVALCEGRGERVTPLPAAPLEALLVLPSWGISTAAAYAVLGGEPLGTRRIEPFLRALEAGDAEAAGRESFNRFEPAVERLEPRQGGLHARLEAAGAGTVRMSGSGSALWCLPPAETPALRAAAREIDPAARLLVPGACAEAGR